jgi:hypothetical protein
MSDAVFDKFVDALRRDPAFAECAQSIADWIGRLDDHVDSSPDCAAFYEAMRYVISRPDRLLREKVNKIDELLARRGRQEGKIREIVGWR